MMSTLWPIPDTTTVGLMTSFYRQLLAGHDISQALRHAQIEALRQPETSHPFYWAGFRITGHAAHPFSTAAAQHPRHPDTQ